MSQAVPPPPPFAFRDDFLARGLAATILEGPLDCAICREPLANNESSTDVRPSQPARVESICRIRQSSREADESSMVSEPPYYCTASTQTTDFDPHEVPSNFCTTVIDTEPIPETPVRLHPCNHIFGSTCLETWFRTTVANHCPLCNHILFPKRRIQLGFREPTRAMRASFADYIEHGLDDLEYAEEIRAQLMGEWPRMLMRELVIETMRAEGFEVAWEYVDRDSAGTVFEDDEEEEEDLFEEEKRSEVEDVDEEMYTDSECEEGESDDDEDDEMQT